MENEKGFQRKAAKPLRRKERVLQHNLRVLAPSRLRVKDGLKSQVADGVRVEAVGYGK